MPHDPITTSRIHLLCQSILSQPFYLLLKAPLVFSKGRELYEWDLDRLNIEIQQFKMELFTKGFIAENYLLYLQPSGYIALDGFENFPFKMLRPDGSWFPQHPTN